MKQNIRWIYKASLGDFGKLIRLQDHIEYYDKYTNLREDIQIDPAAPKRLRVKTPPIKMPEYLEWFKKYLIKKDKE